MFNFDKAETATGSAAPPHPREPTPSEDGLRAVWLRLVVFAAPCLLLTALPVYLIDPYNVLSGRRIVIPEDIKARYAQALNEPLWKLPTFDRDPAENILVGDSQMNKFPTKDIEGVSGRRYCNLAYGGGTLRESIATFWHATSKVRLRSVYFGVSFMSYNAKALDRVSDAQKMLRNRTTYFYDPVVLRTALFDALAVVPGLAVDIAPRVSRDVHWEQQLEYLKQRYSSIVRPRRLKKELVDIVAYCRENRIEFAFVIPPQHIEAQDRVIQLGVVEEYAAFKEGIAELATVLDYDIASEITTDRKNYTDPFHLTDQAGERVARDIWGRTFRWGRKLSASTEETLSAMHR